MGTLTRTDPDVALSAPPAEREDGRKLAILVVHNRYRERGGEDAVFEQEVDLLRREGHHVGTLVVENREEISERPGLKERLALATNTIWSRRSAANIAAAIRRDGPDIVHVHNTFPLLSPSVYRACAALGVPVVQTLHNYRLICPSATLFRDGHVCHDCLGRTLPWPGVVHACYRDSRPQSAVAAGMLGIHNLRGTWHRDVDAYIVLTEFARSLFAEAGLPASKLIVKSNFVEPDPGPAEGAGDGFLFVGRLVAGKGPLIAVDAWERVTPGVGLTMLGGGPLYEEVARRAVGLDGVVLRSEVARDDVFTAIKQARAVIVPQVWYEAFPLTILEAFACGRPVIASRIGAIAEVVRDGDTGLLFEPGDGAELAARVDWAAGHPGEMQRMGQEARREFEGAFSGKRNYERLIAIYDRVIAGHNAAKLRDVDRAS